MADETDETQTDGAADNGSTGPTEPFEGYDALSVDKIVARLDDLSDDDVAQVKAYEAGNKNRSGVMNYSRATAEHEEEDVFTRDRLFSTEGARITGHSIATIAGALHGDDSDTFTREDLESRIAEYLEHEDESQTAEEARS